jgi:RNA polymerase sigma-70 factor (ECF subfamily)
MKRMKAQCSSEAFDADVVAILPALRRHALALTHNLANAEDLVQEAVCNAFAAKSRFVPRGPLSHWMHRILRNRYLSDVRKFRPTVDLVCLPESSISVHTSNEDHLVLREMLHHLPPEHLELLDMVAVKEMSYDEVALLTGVAVGTVKSRVFRLRRSKTFAAFR